MYTSYIGKKFLKLYNEKEGKNYSAEEFFDKEFFPLFFDDNKHLMHVHGSTFFQSLDKKTLTENTRESLIRLNRLKKDVSKGRISGSMYVGYAAEGVSAVTSGQVSNLNIQIDKEEIYASWIGQGLSIRVSGGLLLFANEEILWHIFQGWKLYRKFINQTPNLKGRQIECWNGQFIYFTFPDTSNRSLLELEDFNPEIKDKEETLSIKVIPWIKLIFVLAKKFPNQVMMAYTYELSKVNSSYGFINIFFPEIRKMYELRDIFFKNNSIGILKDKDLESLSTFYYYLKDICKLGTIGLKALEPAKLREYMPKGSMPYAQTQGKEYKFINDESYINYNLFKIWIIAMLNKTELLESANKIAAILIAIENQKSKDSSRGKTDITQESKEFLDSKSLKNFVEGLTTLIKDAPEKEIIKKTLEEVLLLPIDLFPLFMVLIRFEYSYLKK